MLEILLYCVVFMIFFAMWNICKKRLGKLQKLSRNKIISVVCSQAFLCFVLSLRIKSGYIAFMKEKTEKSQELTMLVFVHQLTME